MKILKFNEYIREEADYRNVTGYGSSGSPDPQNAGPSFNKGPDAAVYNRPEVIGVERDTIEDPYFNQVELKRKRVKKHPHVEKNRKKQSKYLRDIDRETLKNRIDEAYKNIDEGLLVSSILKKRDEWKRPTITGYDDFALENASIELTKRFKDKWVCVDDFDIVYKVSEFKINLLGTKIELHYSYEYYSEFDIKYKNKDKTYIHVNPNSIIYEMKSYKKRILKTQLDPFGEENWDF